MSTGKAAQATYRNMYAFSSCRAWGIFLLHSQIGAFGLSAKALELFFALIIKHPVQSQQKDGGLAVLALPDNGLDLFLQVSPTYDTDLRSQITVNAFTRRIIDQSFQS